MVNKSIKRKSPLKKLSARLAKRWVWSGKIKKTPSGLTKKDLMKNKHGKIVSRKKHSIGKKMAGTTRR